MAQDFFDNPYTWRLNRSSSGLVPDRNEYLWLGFGERENSNGDLSSRWYAQRALNIAFDGALVLYLMQSMYLPQLPPKYKYTEHYKEETLQANMLAVCSFNLHNLENGQFAADVVQFQGANFGQRKNNSRKGYQPYNDSLGSIDWPVLMLHTAEQFTWFLNSRIGKIASVMVLPKDPRERQRTEGSAGKGERAAMDMQQYVRQDTPRGERFIKPISAVNPDGNLQAFFNTAS